MSQSPTPICLMYVKIRLRVGIYSRYACYSWLSTQLTATAHITLKANPGSQLNWLQYHMTSFHIYLHPSDVLPHPPTSIYIHLHPSTSIYIHLHPSTSRCARNSNPNPTPDTQVCPAPGQNPIKLISDKHDFECPRTADGKETAPFISINAMHQLHTLIFLTVLAPNPNPNPDLLDGAAMPACLLVCLSFAPIFCAYLCV